MEVILPKIDQSQYTKVKNSANNRLLEVFIAL